MRGRFVSRAGRGHIDSYFFAALPDRDTAKAIVAFAAQERRRLGLIGKLQAPERLHVTLCPVPLPPDTPESAMVKVHEAAEAVAMPPFRVMFNRLMSFGGEDGSRALVLCRGEGTIGLELLHDAVHLAMRNAGFYNVSVPKSFHPHVTLMYGDHDLPEQTVDDISWQVERLTLVHSLQGRGVHIPLAEWRLRGHLPVASRGAMQARLLRPVPPYNSYEDAIRDDE